MLIVVSMATLCALGGGILRKILVCLVRGMEAPTYLLPGVLTDSLAGAHGAGRPRAGPIHSPRRLTCEARLC